MTNSGRSVLVTGANGFVGRALVQRLIADGHMVSGLDMAPDPVLVPGLQRFYAQDIGLPFDIAQPFDFVFHLAARNITHVGALDYAELQRVNVAGAQNVMRAVTAPDFVFMSTSKVYQQAGQPIDESSPTAPLADYERSKLEAEHALAALFAGQRLTIFRAVNIVGRGQAEKALVPVLFANAYAGRSLDIFALLKGLKKSARGEYEVTDALATYARLGLLTYSILKSAWTDAGSFESLYRATVLMKRLEDQQRRKSG